jgi:hypothetical protein
MASNVHLAIATRNAMLNGTGLKALCDSGFIDIMSGSQPANADTAIGAQVVLASPVFNATSFGAASSGSMTAGAITSGTGTAGSGSGTAAPWARCYKSDHTTTIMDLSVGTSGCDINLTDANISTGATVAVTSGTLSLPA